MERLSEAYSLTTRGKFSNAVEAFRYILLCVPLLSIEKKDEADAHGLIKICTQYIVGINMEISRKALPQDNICRNAEMACYFTHCELQAGHLILTLRTASNMLFKMKNFGMAATMTKRLLDMAPAHDVADKVIVFMGLHMRLFIISYNLVAFVTEIWELIWILIYTYWVIRRLMNTGPLVIRRYIWYAYYLWVPNRISNQQLVNKRLMRFEPMAHDSLLNIITKSPEPVVISRLFLMRLLQTLRILKIEHVFHSFQLVNDIS